MAEPQSKALCPSDCLLFSTADWDTPYWTNKQHTAHHLAQQGIRVLYVESVGLRAPNLASGRDLARIWKRLLRSFRAPRPVENGVWVLSPLVIPFKHQWSLIRTVNQGLLRWSIRYFLKAQSFIHPMVWTYHPFMLEAVDGISTGPLVYHCVDDLSAIPGIDTEAFIREEQRLLAAANVVFTTSPALRDKCGVYNSNVHDFPNVADAEHFSQALRQGNLPADMVPIPEPRIGYVGVLSDFKVDFQLLLDVARQKPEWQFVLIGEEREGQSSPLVRQLQTLPNVHFLGYRPYEMLPSYLRGFNVALLPTLLNEYTRAMFPMKYFEYLAAGVPVVATPLEFTQHHLAGLEVGYDAKSFEKSIQRQLQRGKLTPQEVANFVGENTWGERLKKMLNQVEYAV